MSLQKTLDTFELRELTALIFAEGKKQGATDIDLGIHVEKGFDVNVRSGDVETLEHRFDQDLSLTVYFGKKKGSASCSNFSTQACLFALEKACTFARHANEDHYAGLAEPNELASHLPDLDLYHPWPLTPQQAIASAVACEAHALQQDKRVQQCEGVSVSNTEAWELLANTAGFIGSYYRSEHSVSCSVIAEAQDGNRQRDSEWAVALNASQLPDWKSIAEKAVQNTLGRLQPRTLKARHCPVVFHHQIARTIIRHFLSAISGGNLYRKQSFLCDYLGKIVFPKHIFIRQQPHLLGCLGSASFDNDGVATRDQYYVRDGVLENYILGTYSARKLGLKTTGNAGGVFNLNVAPTTGNLTTLLRQMHTGLLVTEVMGQGANIVTGDYSRGAAGFWVENGEIQYPVDEITIAGNLKDMFQSLVAVGDDIDYRSSVLTGSLLIENMTVAGGGD